MVFGMNDLDETLPGPFEWDLKRLVASFAVAGRDRGFAANGGPDNAGGQRAAYREGMRDFASKRDLDVWYARLDMTRSSPQVGKRQQQGAARGRA